MALSDAQSAATTARDTTAPAMQDSLRGAMAELAALEGTFGADSDYSEAITSMKIARAGSAITIKNLDDALTFMGVLPSGGDQAVSGSPRTLALNRRPGSLATTGITVGDIVDSNSANISGATFTGGFTATYVPDSGTPDQVKWYIDGTLYRDDDITAPFNLRYNNDPLPIGTSFSGESAPAGSDAPASFLLDEGSHTITAIEVRAGVERSVVATFTVEAVVTGGGGGSAPPAGPMLWAPPLLSPSTDWSDRAAVQAAAVAAGFTVVNLGAGGNTTIRNAGADIFVNQTGVRTGSVLFENCRHVIWRGGEVNVASDNGFNNTNMIGRFKNCSGIAHIEGVKGTGSELVEGFHGGSSSPGFQLQIMNCFVDWIHGNEAINHSDPIQMYDGAQAVRVDLFTYKSHYQGMMMKADNGTPAAAWTLGRTNGYMAQGAWTPDNDPNAGGRYGFWNTGSIQSITCLYDDGNWLDTNDSFGNHSKAIWNGQNGNLSSDGTGTYTEFVGTNQSGKVYAGTPPGGDWVDPVNIGMLYANADGYV